MEELECALEGSSKWKKLISSGWMRIHVFTEGDEKIAVLRRPKADLSLADWWRRGSPEETGVYWLAWAGHGGGYNMALGEVFDGYPESLEVHGQVTPSMQLRIRAWEKERLESVGHTRYLYARILGFGVRDLQTTLDPIFAYLRISVPYPPGPTPKHDNGLMPVTGPEERWRCVKCGMQSGDDWSQCEGDCPVPFSPHYLRWKRPAESTATVVAPQLGDLPICVACDLPILGVQVGAGDGTGQKFAHPGCYVNEQLKFVQELAVSARDEISVTDRDRDSAVEILLDELEALFERVGQVLSVT